MVEYIGSSNNIYGLTTSLTKLAEKYPFITLCIVCQQRGICGHSSKQGRHCYHHLRFWTLSLTCKTISWRFWNWPILGGGKAIAAYPSTFSCAANGIKFRSHLAYHFQTKIWKYLHGPVHAACWTLLAKRAKRKSITLVRRLD